MNMNIRFFKLDWHAAISRLSNDTFDVLVIVWVNTVGGIALDAASLG